MQKGFKRMTGLFILTLVVSALFSLIPAVSSLTAKEVYAAEEKASLGNTDYTIGVNSSPEYIELENDNYRSNFLYKSANTDIVKVDRSGCLTGITKGKTTVSVKENLNGSLRDLGNISVRVAAAQLSDKKAEVGLNASESILVSYANQSATYRYKSSNKKAITIDQNGMMNGLTMGGKSIITVTETLQGKTRNVGSVKAVVVHAFLDEKVINMGIKEQNAVALDGVNPYADYTYSSADKRIAAVNNQGLVTGIKVGKTKINVSETYKKKTVKIGSITVSVIRSSISPSYKSIDIGINSRNNLIETIGIDHQIFDNNVVYSCVSADNSIVAVGKEKSPEAAAFGSYYFTGAAFGQTTLTVYETCKGEKRTLGTVNITVKDIPIESFSFDNYYFEDDGNNNLRYTYYLNYGDDYYDNVGGYLSKYPENATTPITYKSSNDKVIKVNSEGKVSLIGEGTATITATCGKFTATYNAVVRP